MNKNEAIPPKLYITKKAREQLDKEEDLEKEKRRLLQEAKEQMATNRRARAEAKYHKKMARKILKAKLFGEAMRADDALRTNLTRLSTINDKVSLINRKGEQLEQEYHQRCARAQDKVDEAQRKIAHWQTLLKHAHEELGVVVDTTPPMRADLQTLEDNHALILDEIRDRLVKTNKAWKALDQDGAYSHNAASRARTKHRDVEAKKEAKRLLQEQKNDD